MVIAVGGSQEVLNARPGSYRVVLKNRKGFIKLAITTGASIVPVFSFGENDIYNQPNYKPGSKALKFQEWFKKATGTSLPLINGRGFFQYSFGIIPKRHPITTVVGSPIVVVKNDKPTTKEIEDLHNIFICKLKKLFNEHKKSYVKNFKNIELIIE